MDSKRDAARSPQQEGSREIRPLLVLATLLRNWRTFAVWTTFGITLAAVLAFVLPPKFVTQAMILPQSGDRPQSSLMSLAQQFGMGLSPSGTSPEFYVRLLDSRSLRDSVLLGRYPDPRTDTAGDTASLVQILGVKGDTDAERMENAREALQKITRSSVDETTGLITLSVTSRYPELAAAIANRQVRMLESFNRVTRQQQARERRRFIEERLGTARAEYEEAEDVLRGFLEANRVFTESPQLTFQHDQFQRDLAIKQEILLTLTRQREEARIDEVNDTPLLTVVDWAIPPARRDSPKLLLSLVLGTLLGGITGLSVVVLREYRRGAERAVPEDYSALQQAWSEMRTDFRRFLLRP
jgi:uncharacterized protein involved in exopolysaccharide biosynthesis